MAYSRSNKSGFVEIDIPFKPILIIGLIGSVLWLLFGFTKKISDTLGITKTDEEKAEQKLNQDNQQNKFGTTGQTTTTTTGGVRSTKTKSEWVSIADMIYEFGRYSSIDDKKEELGAYVCVVQNTTDYWELFNAFGTRQEYLFGLPIGNKQDLKLFVQSNLSPEKIAKINDNYRRKAIKQTY